MSKTVKEWCVSLSWGKLAMISWGDPKNPPVLMVHGYMDSAATFTPLVEHLPDSYYYVAFDIPGHGLSDPFPPGPLIMQQNIVEVIRIVVEHLKWETFVYMAHSMSCIMGFIYNHVYPGKVTKMIHLDPEQPLTPYLVIQEKHEIWYQYMYDQYYENYERWSKGKPLLYTYAEIVSLIQRNRSLDEDQAKTILSRSLIRVSDGPDPKYKLSWEPRMRKISMAPIQKDTLLWVISTSPPTLMFRLKENNFDSLSKQYASDILEKSLESVPDSFCVIVDGKHDLHITNAEECAVHIGTFLDTKFERRIKSKI